MGCDLMASVFLSPLLSVYYPLLVLFELAKLELDLARSTMKTVFPPLN